MKTLPKHLEPLAQQFLAARRDLHQVTVLDEGGVPKDTAEAYAMHRAVVKGLGWETMGWKVAGTTENIQQALGLEGPIYGRTFKKHRHVSPTTLSCATLLDPLVECEFFVTLKKDLAPRREPWSMAEIIEAVGTVHAGIEVAECRMPASLKPSTPTILADGSAAGQYVFGGELTHYLDRLSSLSVVLECDGVVVKQGCGADVMGDPLRPILWLAEELRSKWNDGIYAGELISTGSMTGMLPVKAGQSVKAIFGDGDAIIEIAFED